MLAKGVPREAVRHKMIGEGCDQAMIEYVFLRNSHSFIDIFFLVFRSVISSE